MIENIKNYILIALICLVVGAGASGWMTYHYTSKYDAGQQKIQIDALNQKSDKTLADANQAKNQAELDLANARGDIDNEYKDRINSLQGDVAKLAADNKRLRDPGTHKSSPSTTSPGSNGTGSSIGSNSGSGLLSEETSQFLWSFAGESDQYLERLRACKAWTDKLTTIINTQNDQFKKINEKSASGN